jgi:hypothetical protein
MRVAAFTIAPAAFAFGLIAISECGDGGQSAAPLDAASDALPQDAAASPPRDSSSPTEGAAVDTGSAYTVSCANSVDDAGYVTDWPLWRRVQTIPDPCTLVDTPVDVDASVRPLSWHNCIADSGSDAQSQPSCLDIDVPANAVAPTHFINLETGRDSSGLPTTVLLGYEIDVPNDDIAEYDIFDFTTGAPLAAWRNNPTLHASSCLLRADVSGSIATLTARMWGPGDILYATATPPLLASAPSFHRITGLPWQAAEQDTRTSTTTYAFDLEPGGVIDRVAIGSATPISAGYGGPQLFLDFVQNDDVFATLGGGWLQEYVVGANGSVVLLRAVPSRHVISFATDGRSLFWTEGFGGATSSDPPTSYEVWTAPYTTDPSVVAASARRLSTLSAGPGFAGGGTAVLGTYLTVIGDCAEITRIADGDVRQLCVGPTSYFGGWLFFTQQELWAIIGTNGGPVNYTVRRLPMPTW